jgi:hypothetical protein
MLLHRRSEIAPHLRSMPVAMFGTRMQRFGTIRFGNLFPENDRHPISIWLFTFEQALFNDGHVMNFRNDISHFAAQNEGLGTGGDHAEYDLERAGRCGRKERS